MQQKTKGLVESALMAALMSVLTIMMYYIPVLSFAMFLIPTAFIVLGKRQGIQFSILAMIVWSIIISFLVDPIQAVFWSILYGFTAIPMAYMVSKNYKHVQTLLVGCLASLVGTIIVLSIAPKIIGVDIIEQLMNVTKESIDMQIQLYQSVGIDNLKLDELKNIMESTIQLFRMSIPAFMVIGLALMVYMNYLLSLKILRRTGYDIKPVLPFKYIRLPRHILLGTFLIGILTLLTQKLDFGYYDSLVINVFLIFSFIYLIQGVGVMSFFLHRMRMHKVFRIIIYVLLLMNSNGLFILSTLGLIDVIFNIRKLKTEN